MKGASARGVSAARCCLLPITFAGKQACQRAVAPGYGSGIWDTISLLWLARIESACLPGPLRCFRLSPSTLHKESKMILSTTPTPKARPFASTAASSWAKPFSAPTCSRICSPASATSSAAAPAPMKRAGPGPGNRLRRAQGARRGTGGQCGGRHRHRLRGGGTKRQHADGQHQRHRRAGLSLHFPCFGKGR